MIACPKPNAARINTNTPNVGANAHAAEIADHKITVLPIVRTRGRRSAK